MATIDQMWRRQWHEDMSQIARALDLDPGSIREDDGRDAILNAIARVRRDAAREALDGLYEDASQDYRIGLQGDDQERMNAAEAVLRATYAWMDHYPEESP